MWWKLILAVIVGAVVGTLVMSICTISAFESWREEFMEAQQRRDERD